MLIPIYLLIVNALSAPAEVTGFPKRLFPTFDSGASSFFVNYAGVARALWNSVLVAALTMVLSIGIGAPAGYALSRFDFPGKEAFRFLVLMTRAFPLPLLALPLAVMFIRTGLDDTAFGLALVHTTLALPFAVLITFSLFSGIPFELEEAAWTLGCTRLQAFIEGRPAAGPAGHHRVGHLRLRHLLERGFCRCSAHHREPHADGVPAAEPRRVRRST